MGVYLETFRLNARIDWGEILKFNLRLEDWGEILKLKLRLKNYRSFSFRILGFF